MTISGGKKPLSKTSIRKKVKFDRASLPESCSREVPRMQAVVLKEPLSLRKSRQAFLRKHSSMELNPLLSDYVNVILKLTGTTAGTSFLRAERELVFRAVRGRRHDPFILKT